jgi:hypothetical protein
MSWLADCGGREEKSGLLSIIFAAPYFHFIPANSNLLPVYPAEGVSVQ